MPEFRCHPGHRVFIGGRLDGKVEHLVYADPSDYPMTLATVPHNGHRDEYERDLDGGPHCLYRFVQTTAQLSDEGSV